jgi:hypothetical protein
MEGFTRCAVIPNEAPVLLIEDVVRVRANSRCNTTRVVGARTASAILPPLVGELKDEPAKADTIDPRRQLRHNLRGEHLRCLGLVSLIDSSNLRVVGVSTKLSDEHWFFADRSPLVKEMTEGKPVVRGDAPNIYVWKAGNHGSTRHHAVDRGDWVCRVNTTDNPCYLLHTGHSIF